MTGLSRATAAQTLADLFGTHAEHSGGGYDAYRVKDMDGKEYKEFGGLHEAELSFRPFRPALPPWILAHPL